MREANDEAPGVAGRPSTVFPLAASAVERAVATAGPALTQLIEAALPSAQTLRTLGDEVRKAVSHPKAVAHPGLADPDEYWRLAAYPQAASLVRQLRGVLVDVAGELAPAVDGSRVDFELWLRATVAAEAANRRRDPETSRDEVIDQIAERCGELDEIMASVESIVPTSARVDELRAELRRLRRKRIHEEARRSGDPTEVAEARLRQEPPFRHQDLLIDAFAMVYATLADDVSDMVDHLTAPIFGLGERMVMAYEDVVATMDADPAPVGERH